MNSELVERVNTLVDQSSSMHSLAMRCLAAEDDLARRDRASPEMLAKAFHEAYERLAPSFGYETRRESAKPWEAVPAQNRLLMIAVAADVLWAVNGGKAQR